MFFDALDEQPQVTTTKRRPSGASFSDLDAFDIGALLEDDGVAMIDSFGLDDTMDIDMDLEPALVSSSGPQHTRRGKRDRSSSPPPPIREISISHSSPHHERHTSTSDLSMTSSSSSSNYTEALQSLANSMKRTESTRKFMVQMKQQYLTPEQQEALSNAKEQLSKQNQLVSQQSSSAAGSSSFFGALGASQKKLNQYLGNTVGQTL